jgi:hypothetical protein
MAFAHAVAYKDHVILNGATATSALNSSSRDIEDSIPSMTSRDWSLLVLAAAAYGLLIAAVAADYPSGVVVALVYTIVYGIGGIGGYLVCSFIWKNNEDKIITMTDGNGNGHNSDNATADGRLQTVFNDRTGSKDNMESGDDNHAVDTNTTTNDSAHVNNTTEEVPAPLPKKSILQSVTDCRDYVLSRPVLYYFLLSYAFALALVILWIIVVGGVKSRNQSRFRGG